MPLLVRWYIKAALVYLVLGLCLGVYLALPGAPQTAGYFPTYLHILTFGWLTQLIFGVVFWMFPKYSRERPRGYEQLGWATFVFLNLGLILRMIFESLYSGATSPLAGGGLVISALLQWLAGVTFVINTWKRVKEK
ncbi:MAG: hypothetical protein QME21_16480 [Anaerolineales bacterium]|jgi:hypothetical protein|nr:hypothetical protein [Anaerolineales bacterium]